MTLTWTVQLSCIAPGLSEDRRLDIVEELSANAVYDSETGKLVLTFEVTGATLRQAADEALRTAGAAVGTKPTRIRIMPTEDFIAELSAPGAQDLVGLREIAAQFGVSSQRAHQITQIETMPDGQPGFPEPVSRLASGPIFTKASVDAFAERWEPFRVKRGGGFPRKGGPAEALGSPGAPRRGQKSSTVSAATQ
ncbi:hypothetical protein ACWDTP_34035 [Mycobacterium sp. NPDC003449]